MSIQFLQTILGFGVADVDRSIIRVLNAGAQRFEWFDQFVVFLTNSDLVKGGIVVSALLAVWFCAREHAQAIREALFSAIAGSLFTLLIARVLAHVTTLRLRPVLDPALHFRPPTGLPNQSNWTSWSSFPSDHASLFFALAYGVFRVNRRVGLALLVYVALVICLPRLYIGIHYPSDILVGAVLAIGAVALFDAKAGRLFVAQPVLAWGSRHPGVFHFLLFLLLFQIATLFWDLRIAMSYLGWSS